MTEKELKQVLKDSGVRLLENNLVQGTWGNTSVRLDSERMIVTPSGMDYLRLTVEDMPIVNMTTFEWEGGKKPTSEKKIHAAILLDRPEINAVIHSHPTYCSILAAARVPLPVMSEKMQALVGGECKVGKYGLPSTKKLTKGTVEAMKGRNACLMANHGVMAAGKDMDEAFEIIKIMEESAKLFIEKCAMEKMGAKVFSAKLIHDYYTNLYK